MPKPNQTPEQAARDNIDKMLSNAGWIVQDKKKINWTAGPGIAVREYQTDVGPADYVLFAGRKPVGVIEAKAEELGQKLTTVEGQSGAYAAADLKWVTNQEPLPFIYESTGVVTRFTDARDPKPRSREVFNFPRPETLQEWRNQPNSLRSRLQGLPALDPAGLRDCQINAIEKLDASFKDNHPRALIQMATGSGKTYTAITSIYRLLKHAGGEIKGRPQFSSKKIIGASERGGCLYLVSTICRTLVVEGGVTSLPAAVSEPLIIYAKVGNERGSSVISMVPYVRACVRAVPLSCLGWVHDDSCGTRLQRCARHGDG